MAVGRVLRGSGLACLAVEQDRAQNGLHVAPDTLSVVVEDSCDALDVPWTGIGCHEMLDQNA